MEEVTNLLEFAIEEATLSYDLDDRPIIDKNKLIDMLTDIINRRENALKYRIKKEAQEAIKKVLQEV
jgi:hypothetical protein